MNNLSPDLVDLYVKVVAVHNKYFHPVPVALDGKAMIPRLNTTPMVDEDQIRKIMPMFHCDKYLLREIETIDAEVEKFKERERNELSDAEKEKASMLFQKYKSA